MRSHISRRATFSLRKQLANKPRTENTLHLAFSPSLETRFKAAEDQIKFQTKHLKLQVETAGHQASEKRHRAVCNILETKMGASSGFHSSIHALRFIQNSVRNDRFFGREDVLDHLSQLLSNKLSEDGHRLSSVVVHGLGGCGKSSVAREFMYRHFDYYPVILWLHADTPEKLETQFVQIARALGFVTDSGINRSREEVLHWITNLGKYKYYEFIDSANQISILKIWNGS
jgi:hypothetical protein